MIPEKFKLRSGQLPSGVSLRAIYFYAEELPGIQLGSYDTWLKIDTYKWGFGQGPGTSAEDLTLYTSDKRVASKLMLHLVTGRHLDKVLLDFVGEQRRLFRWMMKVVFVTSYATATAADSFTLRFGTIEFAYN